MKFLKIAFLSLIAILLVSTYAYGLNADFSWMKDNAVDQKSIFVAHTMNVDKVAVAVYGKYVHLDSKAYRWDGNVDLTRKLSVVNLSGSYRYKDDVLKYHEYVLGAGFNVTKWLSLNVGYKQNLDQNLTKINHKMFVPWTVFNYSNKDVKLFWKTSVNINRTLNTQQLDHVGVASLNVTKHVYVSYNFEEIRKSRLQRIAVGLNL